MPNPHSPRAPGFTLIEVLIAVAIVAILAAFAYPSYQEQVRKARRADAQTVLMEGAQFMERLYTETGCFNAGADADCSTAADAGVVLPYTESPIDGQTKYYDIRVPAVTATTYRLEASPKGTQAGDGCGTMTLDQVGQKTAAKNYCWKK